MLYSVDDQVTPITTMPHKSDYDRWMSNLAQTDHDVIVETLNKKIDGTQIQTSSWMPGKWEGSVYMAIYEACGYDEINSGLFFGLLVWETFMNRPEAWSFGHYSINNVPIRGLTYFTIEI